MTSLSRKPASFTSYLEAAARILVAITFVVAFIVYGIHAVLALLYPYPLDYGEAPLVDQAMRLAAGDTIYRAALDTPPYTIANYPPLYVLAMTPFVWLFGPNFWAGRLISVASALAVAYFLGGVIHAQSGDRFAARLTALLFLAFPYVAGWSKLARIDLLALALSAAALYVIARRPQDNRILVGTALLLTAAIYTRQSYGLAAPFAAFVWVWVKRGWRAAFALAGMVGAVGLTLFVILNMATSGGFFFNVITANVNPFNFATVERYAKEMLDLAPILLVFCGALVVVLSIRRWARLSAVTGWPMVVPYLAGALLSALTIGKIGSNVNYLLELCAALALVAGTLLAWSGEIWRGETELPRPAWVPPLVRSIVLALLAVQGGMLMRFTLQHPVQDFKYRNSFQTSLHELRELVAQTTGPILADEYMGMLTLNDAPLYIQPFEVTQLANAGLWDQTPLLDDIRAEKFALILIHHFRGYPVYKERWTPEMLDVIQEHYVASDIKAETIIFRPRSTAGIAAPVEGACPGAPWPFPTVAGLGLYWYNKTLSLMGVGYENTVPVYAVADGRLMRRADWPDAVAILHDDSLQPGQHVWAFYGGMASEDGQASYVSAAFPPGSVDVPVKAGDLLGYQGSYRSSWVHLHFAVLPPLADRTFPAALVWRDTGNDLSMAQVLVQIDRRSPSDYLGVTGSLVAGSEDWLPLNCQP
ncbi:MAG TPA: glycosyltransferase family 39 protein [Anaerolineae bacterium]|nr:glycosyltransferase family 39 protein [Anaerolineae bacterium]HQI84604.1 glycosyltransferase family 39 protein [Anaerolineae bacterium]